MSFIPLSLNDTFETWKNKFNQAITDINNALQNIPSIDNIAPTNHASTDTKYGIGNDTNYGHIKLSDDINSSSNINSGTGATPLAVKTAYDAASNAQSTANAAQSAANNAQNTANNALTKATTVFAGNTAGIVPEATSGDADFVLRGNGTWSNTGLGPVSEKSQNLGNVTGSKALDLSLGLAIIGTVTGATTFSFTNVPNNAVVVILQLTNGGSQTITWPTSIKWAGGTAPKLTASGIDIIVLTTNDNGTSWYGIANLEYA